MPAVKLCATFVVEVFEQLFAPHAPLLFCNIGILCFTMVYYHVADVFTDYFAVAIFVRYVMTTAVNV
mgnify:CR=1 FL=1